ncbi:MAG TPA: Bax inhibitor-1/YccA family protein [Candidatus Poseidoniales archaeon]|nr:Bax inhibitor-1/YccA family protein [Candidatus Poseidoniales archaeon]
MTTTTALATAFSMPGSAPLMLLGALGGFIVAIIIMFSGSMNPILICTYAALQGLLIGGFTWYFEVPLGLTGIGLVAAILTFMILGGMLAIYRAGLISWDRNLAIAVSSAVFAIMMIYIVSMVGAITGWFHVPYIHGAGPWGIAFSLFVVGIGALCLVADFDFIERGVQRGAPKQMEWRAAFGLMVTLIWLYLEILKLLAKIAIATRR